MKSPSCRKAASSSLPPALFEKRLVIQRLIDRARLKKLNLNGQKTHFYRLQAVLEATVQRLYNDLKRIETLERKRLCTTSKTIDTSSSSPKKRKFSSSYSPSRHHSKSQKPQQNDLNLLVSPSIDSSSSSSSSSSEDEEEMSNKNYSYKNFRHNKKNILKDNDDPFAINDFFQRLKTVSL